MLYWEIVSQWDYLLCDKPVLPQRTPVHCRKNPKDAASLDSKCFEYPRFTPPILAPVLLGTSLFFQRPDEAFQWSNIKLDVTRSMNAHVADFHRTCMICKWLQAFHYSTTPQSSHKLTNFLSLLRPCLNLIVKIAPQNRYQCSIRKLNIEFEALGNVNPTLGTQRRTILLQMLACGRGGEKLCIAAGRQKMAVKIGINWDTTVVSQLSLSRKRDGISPSRFCGVCNRLKVLTKTCLPQLTYVYKT